ncbi:MAG: HD domain-containing phosphohydrolase [Desulfobacterales bacterium]|nr:HD domain-containing phosphohydrolase [Desulfobacterales bacterium]
MTTLKLTHNIFTLDNRQLLPAGTAVSNEVVEELISMREGHSTKSSPFLKYRSIKDNILLFFSQPPYDTIFADEKRISSILNLMEQVNVPYPVLEIMDYFKLNDFYTYRHFLMVYALLILLAQNLMGNHNDMLTEVLAGPTHDLGKICVPLNILKKTDPLTRSERLFLEHHTVAGYVLLSYHLQDSKNFSAKAAMEHHERNDGSGYPRGIYLKDRMVEIVIVSDIYDALLSPRPYRRLSYDNRTALEEISGMAEKGKISWEIVQAIVAVNRKDRPHYSECVISSDKRGTSPPDNLYGIILDEETQ